MDPVPDAKNPPGSILGRIFLLRGIVSRVWRGYSCSHLMPQGSLVWIWNCLISSISSASLAA